MFFHLIAMPMQLQSNYDRRVGEDVFFIKHCTVDQESSIRPHFLPIATVNVSEDVELRLDPQNGFNQFLAAESL
jgi:hypothetical protein